MVANILIYITLNINMYKNYFSRNMIIYDLQAQNINFLIFIKFFQNFEIFIRRFPLQMSNFFTIFRLEETKNIKCVLVC